jgi:hypothetical protein
MVSDRITNGTPFSSGGFLAATRAGYDDDMTLSPAEERYPLSSGYALLKAEARHLRVEEHGDPSSAEEMSRYFAAIERALALHGFHALLIVAQRQAPDASAPRWKPIRAARWRALATSRARRIAVLVDDALSATRVRMSALAERAPVRPFLSEADACAWLSSAADDVTA